MSTAIGVLKERVPDERRVAITPDAVKQLTELGLEVLIERDAGASAWLSDEAYRNAGARVLDSPEAVCQEAGVILKVRAPLTGDNGSPNEVAWLQSGTILIGLLDPYRNKGLMQTLADQGVTALSMDAIPRITRAQEMDALSSQATAAGYQAALLAARASGKFFPMLVTAAGTIAPARVFILGAGVAGLQAIATARRLGAVVTAFDIRPAVKEQVESLGAKFLEVEWDEAAEGEGGYAQELSEEAQKREQALIHEHAADADVVITTAQVPGRPAPIIITRAMVSDMKPGSIILDVAAEAGGNCELTEPGTDVVHQGVTVMGPLNLPSTMPTDASRMYARNLSRLLKHMTREQEVQVDMDDEIVGVCCVVHRGEVRENA